MHSWLKFIHDHMGFQSKWCEPNTTFTRKYIEDLDVVTYLGCVRLTESAISFLLIKFPYFGGIKGLQTDTNLTCDYLIIHAWFWLSLHSRRDT